MADLSKLKHLFDISDPTEQKFNMTAPENLMATSEEPTPESDPSAFEPAVADDDGGMTQKSPGALATPEEIAKIQSLPLPEAQRSIRTPAQTPEDTSSIVPKAAPVSSPESEKLKRYQDLLSSVRNLKGAQSSYRDQLGNLGLLQGGDQIAQAIASGYGGKIGDGSDAIKMLKETAYRPVQEIEENLKLGQEGIKAENSGMELQRLLQAGDKDSPISKLARQQAATGMAMLTGGKRGTPEFDAAVQKYLKEFEGLSALDLEKGVFGKTGMLSKTPTTAGFGQFIDAKSGHPLISRSFMGQTEVVDAVTGQVVDPSNAQIVRPIGYNDPQTGNRGYLTPQGMYIPGQQNGGHAPQQAPTATPDATATPSADQSSASATPAPAKEYTMADLNKINPKFADKQIKDIKSTAAHDKELEKIKEMNLNGAILFTKLRGLDPANPGDVDSGMAPSLAAQMASMAQGGNSRIAAEFINKYNGAGGIEARFKRFIENNLAGKLTKEDRDFFAEAGQAFNQAANEMYTPIAQNYANQLKSLYPELNISDKNAQDLLGLNQDLTMKNTALDKYKDTVGMGNAGPSNLVTIQGPSGQTVKMTKDKAQKYLSKPGYSLVK